MRRITPPRSNASSGLPPLHHRGRHASHALSHWLCLSLLPSDRLAETLLDGQPCLLPCRVARMGNSPLSCHISQAVALRHHWQMANGKWQCLWLWLHWLGYQLRQNVRRPGCIACKACRIDAHCGAIALSSCARQTWTARYFSEARSFPAG